MIYMYLDRHRLIKDSQQGFAYGRRYLMNLIGLVEEVTKKVDVGKYVDDTVHM